MLRWLAEGRLAPRIAARIPLEEAVRAHALLESGSAAGKIVLIAGA
jgi:NADPH2:quinone reductase